MNIIRILLSCDWAHWQNLIRELSNEAWKFRLIRLVFNMNLVSHRITLIVIFKIIIDISFLVISILIKKIKWFTKSFVISSSIKLMSWIVQMLIFKFILVALKLISQSLTLDIMFFNRWHITIELLRYNHRRHIK